MTSNLNRRLARLEGLGESKLVVKIMAKDWKPGDETYKPKPGERVVNISWLLARFGGGKEYNDFKS